MASKRRFVYTDRSVRRQGRRDGRDWWWKLWPPKWPFREPKEPQPSVHETEPAEFERALKEAAENDMQIVAEDWADQDKKLKPQYCAALVQWRQAKERAEKEGKEVAPAVARFDEAERKFLQLDAPALDPQWMLFWLIAIAVAEFPLNTVVFQLLGQRMRETYLIAAGLALVIPLLAHTFGAALRQTAKNFIDKCLIATAPLVAFGLLFVVAIVRERFMELSPLAQKLKVVTPVQGTVLFLSINVALFFVATVLSYEGTHLDRRLYKTRRRNLRHARRSLSKESAEAAEAARHEELLATTLQRKRTTRQKAFEHAAAAAALIKENADAFVGVYRTANLESRKNAEKPASFRRAPPEAKPPASLEELDWGCEDVVQGRSA